MAKDRVYYAWSDILTHDSVLKQENGLPAIRVIKVGAKVTRSDVSDADWGGLVEAGVLRTDPYPINVRTYESPKNAQLREMNEKMKVLQDSYNPRHDLEDEPEDDEGLVLFEQEAK